ncbi:uncharacterized protein LOC133312362 [Gastrolobium bilobum]|uniref:uncharacterized protein LOC133312362 n=1 Tax=Gastrolobium bilobum TaxID=150636 RepID=UPI002AB11BFF|nr:uncharacterized protein LOC133312362 [Gastrolobium bilobum]
MEQEEIEALKNCCSEDGHGQIAQPSFSEPPTTKDVDIKDSQETSEFEDALTKTHAPVFLNDDASMKVSSIIKEHTSNEDNIGVSESKGSPSIPSPIASQSPSVPFEGNSSQNMEDLNFASLVKRELEQLVSKKRLAPENLSLLTDFLVKHPSVCLSNACSERCKGHAYDCLAELLKFLQTHSAFDVLESSHSDLVQLLQDMRRFPFGKDWLDEVERRVL